MGCLLVYNGEVIGRGRNEVNETKNVSATGRGHGGFAALPCACPGAGSQTCSPKVTWGLGVRNDCAPSPDEVLSTGQNKKLFPAHFRSVATLTIKSTITSDAERPISANRDFVQLEVVYKLI